MADPRSTLDDMQPMIFDTRGCGFCDAKKSTCNNQKRNNWLEILQSQYAWATYQLPGIS